MTEPVGLSIELIERLLRQLEREKISRFEYRASGFALNVTLDFGGLPQPGPRATAEAPREQTIKSNAVGIFHSAHPLGLVPAIEEGSHVRAGQIVGFLQVGPIIRPVLTPSDAIIGAKLVEDEATVGFGQPLFEIRR
jgi:biotin carboxyl carrier protein